MISGSGSDAVRKCEKALPLWKQLNDSAGEMSCWFILGTAEHQEAAQQTECKERENKYTVARGCFQNIVNLARAHG